MDLHSLMRLMIGALYCLVLGSVASHLRAAEFKFGNQTLTVPDGFEVELAAGPPLADRPIVADFDEEGRLYAADSSGSTEKADKQLELKPHRIVRLEDTDGDGRFDRSTVFADRMMFPEGAMWFDGSLYVAAPPSIWKLTDRDGDGTAEERTEWFQGKTLTGCANDLHGPYLGPDGWIYWCKGAFAQQTYERPGKPPFVTRAAHIFRSRPDNSGIEAVMTGGMDNPVDVAFTPAGERILTTTFFQHPEAGKRDGLIHAIYGGVYGKVHDVLDDHKRTGDIMPVLVHLGPAAVCGLTRYTSRSFGAEFQDNFFAALFNLHKVTRHALEPEGATFHSRNSDFVVSDSPDFHPTDVLEDADGSLLVVDTGGWYKVCCPTSQLHKPDVLGAIYRVRRRGAPRIEDPRGRKLPWRSMAPADLARLLADERPAVRSRAIHEAATHGAGAVPALAAALKSSGPRAAEARRSAVWALTRIEGAAAREAVRAALADGDDSVRLAAAHSAALWRDGGALRQLEMLLACRSPHLRRSAAEAVGRIGNRRSVPLLLRAAAAQVDRVLEHSLIYALIEIADPEATAVGLDAESPLVKRAALVALDQMDGGGLKPEIVTPLLMSAEPVLKQTASWLVGHHPEWGGALAGFFRERLAATDVGDAERSEIEEELAQCARDGAIQELLISTLRDEAVSKAALLLSLRAMARAALKETPPAWAAELARILRKKDPDIVRQAVRTLRALPAPKESGAEPAAALLCVARDRSAAAAVRLDALSAVPGGLAAVDAEVFDFLRADLDPAQPVLTRGAAAGVLAKAKLTAEQRLALIDCIGSAGPLEITKLLAAFESAPDEDLGLKLVAALKESAGLLGLHPDTLKPLLAKFPASVQAQGQELVALLNVGAAEQKAHLDELAASLKDGDIRRGQAVFNGPKAACSACHAIGYLGGKVGPDLTTIGQIRTERDLLESIVYPSMSFVRSYEPMVVVTKSGEVWSGVVKQDAPDEVVLATGPDTEARITRQDIIEMQPGTVSVMPPGLEGQLTTEELADLVTFLKATRW